MKFQQEVQGQSRETSESWDDWLRDKKHKQCSLFFQWQGMMRKKNQQISSWLQQNIGGFSIMGLFNMTLGLLATDKVHLLEGAKGSLRRG